MNNMNIKAFGPQNTTFHGVENAPLCRMRQPRDESINERANGTDAHLAALLHQLRQPLDLFVGVHGEGIGGKGVSESWLRFKDWERLMKRN